MPPTPESMFPELPAELGTLSDAELADLAEQYKGILSSIKARDEDTLGERTAEEIIAASEAIADAILAIKAEQDGRVAAEEEYARKIDEAASRAGISDDPPDPDPDPDAPADDPDPDATAVGDPTDPTAAVAEPEPVAASAKPVRRAPLPAARRHRAQPQATPEGTPLLASTFTYPLAEPGEALTSSRLAEIQTDLVNKNRITPGQKVIVASATFQFPEERMLGRDSATNARRIAAVTEPQALVASGGLCAPLTPIYSMPDIETADRPVRDALAGFRADRGGVIVPENPTLVDYEDAVGTVTAEDDALGGTFAVKSCMRVECPDFNSVEVDSIYRCIEVGNLTGRAYPELLSRVDTLVMANHARLAEGILLGAIKGGSTAVTDVNTTSTAGAVWKLLGYLGTSVAGMRSRHRMGDTATIRGLFPAWLPEAIQTDLGRTAFTQDYARAEAVALFQRMGVNATWYKDDALISDGAGHVAPTGTSQVYAAQTAGNLLPYPTAVQYALYPEGSWLHLDSGSLDLGIVRDSTLNSTNDYQVFAETWEQAALIGVESQWHTATLSFNGTLSAGKDFSAATTF